MFGYRIIYGFFWLSLSRQWGKKLEKLEVIGQSRATFEPIATEVVVRLPGLAAIEVVSQISIFTYDVAIVHLYIQSLIKLL